MSVPKIDNSVLQKICDILGDTGWGFTGSQIGDLLAEAGITDVAPDITKRRRLFEALKARQSQDGCGNNILAFIQIALKPVRYMQDREQFEARRDALNGVLAFEGLELGNDGKIIKRTVAKTIDEAENRAAQLRTTLTRRGVHGDVLSFCRAELLQDNYFHAVFEATKSVADKIRTKTGLTADGAVLVDEALGINRPLLAINSLQTETEQGEQKGLSNLIKGVLGLFRNPTAHEPKIKWNIEENDALDLLVMLSYIHRKLDKAIRTPF